MLEQAEGDSSEGKKIKFLKYFRKKSWEELFSQLIVTVDLWLNSDS